MAVVIVLAVMVGLPAALYWWAIVHVDRCSIKDWGKTNPN